MRCGNFGVACNGFVNNVGYLLVTRIFVVKTLRQDSRKLTCSRFIRKLLKVRSCGLLRKIRLYNQRVAANLNSLRIVAWTFGLGRSVNVTLVEMLLNLWRGNFLVAKP